MGSRKTVDADDWLCYSQLASPHCGLKAACSFQPARRYDGLLELVVPSSEDRQEQLSIRQLAMTRSRDETASPQSKSST